MQKLTSKLSQDPSMTMHGINLSKKCLHDIINQIGTTFELGGTLKFHILGHTIFFYKRSCDLIEVHWGCDTMRRLTSKVITRKFMWGCRLALFKEFDTLIGLLYVLRYMVVNYHSSLIQSNSSQHLWSLHLTTFPLPAVRPVWNQQMPTSGHFHPKFLPTVIPGELQRLFPASPNPNNWQT